MRRQRRTILINTLVGILIYAFCLFILTQFNKQEQIKHMETLKSDYQFLNNEQPHKYLHNWADDHQVKIITPHGTQDIWAQKEVQDLLTQGQLTVEQPYQVKAYKGKKYLLYLLDNSDIKHQKVLLKEYHSIWLQSSLVWIFSLVYFLLWASGITVQYLTYRQQRNYIHAIVRKLKHIKRNQQTDSLITQYNTPYTELIHAVNSLDQHNTKVVDDNTLFQQRFNSLLKHLPVGVMLLDSLGNVVLHNQAMEIILGRSIADNPHPFVEDIQTYALSKLIQHTLKDSHNRHHEVQLFGDSNCFVDANVIHIMPADEDAEQQVIVILYDLTDLQRLEQQQLDFVGNVSHELKTPVTAIAGFTDTLLQGAKDDPQKNTEFLKIIQKETNRLTELIEDSLALASMDQVDNLPFKLINVEDVVQAAISQRQEKISELNLEIKTEIKGSPWVKTAQNEFTQIVNNLLSNAIKYNKSNGQVKIMINHDDKQDSLTLVVQDTGCGIDQLDQEHVFERFYRADKSRNQKISGTGLGLAIVKQAVDKLNGTINLTSQSNQGTAVEVKLPL